MKVDLEPLSGDLNERRYEFGNKSIVVCELVGHTISTYCEHHIVIGNLILGTGVAQQVDEALGNVETTNGDIGILFDGQLSLSGVWVSGRLRELLEGGRVKAIEAGYHFEEEATVESVRQIESTMSFAWFRMILRNAYQYVEELSLTRFAIHNFLHPIWRMRLAV
jgi:hypothetical protein